MDVASLPWPDQDPTCGGVRLRGFDSAHEAVDVAMVRELATDDYVPTISTLTPHADDAAARGWIERQRGRLAEGKGFAFVVADARDRGRPLGFAALWLLGHDEGRASIGYLIAGSAQGRGVASDAAAALVSFAWSLPGLHRVEAYIEPWNTGSWRAAARAGLSREGLLRSHQEIGGERRDMYLYATVR